jgi:hypothetical protein
MSQALHDAEALSHFALFARDTDRGSRPCSRRLNAWRFRRAVLTLPRGARMGWSGKGMHANFQHYQRVNFVRKSIICWVALLLCLHMWSFFLQSVGHRAHNSVEDRVEGAHGGSLERRLLGWWKQARLGLVGHHSEDLGHQNDKGVAGPRRARGGGVVGPVLTVRRRIFPWFTCAKVVRFASGFSNQTEGGDRYASESSLPRVTGTTIASTRTKFAVACACVSSRSHAHGASFFLPVSQTPRIFARALSPSFVRCTDARPLALSLHSRHPLYALPTSRIH